MLHHLCRQHCQSVWEHLSSFIVILKILFKSSSSHMILGFQQFQKDENVHVCAHARCYNDKMFMNEKYKAEGRKWWFWWCIILQDVCFCVPFLKHMGTLNKCMNREVADFFISLFLLFFCLWGKVLVLIWLQVQFQNIEVQKCS